MVPLRIAVVFSSLLLFTGIPSSTLNAQDANKTQTPKPEKGFSQPSCKHCPSPDFPKEARKAKTQSASVLVDVTVTEEGTAKDVRVIRDAGDGFRDTAVRVQKWKFKPAKDKDGHPVAARVNIEVVFHSPD